MVGLEKVLELVYEVFPWHEDLSLTEGYERFKEALDDFRKVLDHELVRSVIDRGFVRVVDICGGGGIGGIALAKVLSEKGVKVDLVVNDLRSSALDLAIRNSMKVLGFKPKIVKANALELYRYGVKADIALLYGLSTPHFNPYEMVRLVASTAKILEPNGVFLVEEADRIYNIFYLVGYKDVVAEYAGEDRVALSIHSGYDVRRGVFYRLFLDIPSMKRVRAPVRFWDIAGTASTLWFFFREVDFVETKSRRRGFIVAGKPRGINPDDYLEYPRIARS